MKKVTPTHGLDVDEQTRCRHWHSPVDVIAIKFACCEQYYACYDCHSELAGHPPQRWPKSSFAHEKVILCGVCKYEMTIKEYQESDSTCPKCAATFNPRCALHWPLYFEID